MQIRVKTNGWLARIAFPGAQMQPSHYDGCHIWERLKKQYGTKVRRYFKIAVATTALGAAAYIGKDYAAPVTSQIASFDYARWWAEEGDGIIAGAIFCGLFGAFALITCISSAVSETEWGQKFDAQVQARTKEAIQRLLCPTVRFVD